MKKTIFLFATIVLMLVACKKKPLSFTDSGTLPVIKLTIDEKYLWSPDSGLYLMPNYLKRWEFPAKIEYSEFGISKFIENVGFRLKGDASRGNSMKSFGIYWRKKYGNKNLKYQMFPDITTSKFKRLFLRNSGNDFRETLIKDASISSIYKDYANVEYQEYKPCVVYLNEEYWGIYNIREMLTPHHFDYHFGVDNNEVDLLEYSEINPKVDNGSKEDYLTEIVDFIKENDLSNQNNYDLIKDKIDVNSYIDYIIINTYISNTDWPIGNSKWWRDKTSFKFKKWRWIIHDTDWAFKGNANIDRIWIGDLYGNYYDETKKDGFYIFNNLIKNDEFKKVFLERYLFFIETVFEKNRVKNIIITNKMKIEREYENHQSKWNTQTKRQWEKSIDDMIHFNNKRNDKMKPIIENLLNEI